MGRSKGGNVTMVAKKRKKKMRKMKSMKMMRKMKRMKMKEREGVIFLCVR